MMWRRNFRVKIAEKQHEADQALARSRTSYANIVTLQLASEKIARSLVEMQTATSNSC